MNMFFLQVDRESVLVAIHKLLLLIPAIPRSYRLVVRKFNKTFIHEIGFVHS